MISLSFLPQKICAALKKTDFDSLSELRLRTGYKIFGIFNGKKNYITENGTSLNKTEAFTCSETDIKEIVNNVTERSLYAFNDRLKQGFLTTKDGVRIGICGDCVFEKNNILTIKKFSSLNVRIPHEIKNCSEKIYNKLFLKEVFNTLIISPPSKGKTTILKDLARKFNDYTDFSVLIIDERGEFYGVTGENIDVMKYSDKDYALSCGVRSMSPDIVITDELQTENDWKSAEHASTDGIKIIASCHGRSIEDIKNKEFFNNKVFERYVLLDAVKPSGTLKGIYDMDFKLL